MELKASFEKLKDMELKKNEWYLPEHMRSDAATKDITSAWEEGQVAPSSPPMDEGGKAGSSTDVHATSSPQKEAEPEAQLALPPPPEHDHAEAETQPVAAPEAQLALPPPPEHDAEAETQPKTTDEEEDDDDDDDEDDEEGQEEEEERR